MFLFKLGYFLFCFYKGRYFKIIFMKLVNVYKNILIYIKKNWFGFFEINFKVV